MIGKTCQLKDCAKPAPYGKFCSMHAARIKRNGSPHTLKNDPVERLFSKCIPQADGCIVFIGLRLSFGHGRLRVKGKKYLAHRFAFELAFGPIPEGKVIRHLCDNPSCVKITHLALGTQKDNVRDCMDKGRHICQNSGAK